MKLLLFSFLVLFFIVLFAVDRTIEYQSNKPKQRVVSNNHVRISKETDSIKILNGHNNAQVVINLARRTILFYVSSRYIKLRTNDIADVSLVLVRDKKMAIRFTVFDSIKHYDVILIDDVDNASSREVERVQEKYNYWKAMVEGLITDKPRNYKNDDDIDIKIL